MKHYLIALLIICSFSIQAQDHYYHYGDSRIPLYLQTSHIYILTSVSSKIRLQEKLQGVATVQKFKQDIYQQRLISKHRNSDARMANPSYYFAQVQLNNAPATQEALDELMLQLEQDAEIINTSYCYKNTDQKLLAITNYIWVGLKNIVDIELLKSEAALIDYAIVGQNPFMPEWVMLCPLHKTSMSQVDAANKLAERNLFTAAEPELMGEIDANCTNDVLFSTQWGLSNTGQYGGTPGMDVKACTAYPFTTGSNTIDVAIVDEGFEMNHPDLAGNVQGTGYNTSAGAQPSVVFGDHGTACAGITAATGNNSLGVTGVAYGADIISVAMDFNTATWAQISDGFNWSASSGGAEILSNSWGWNNPNAMFNAAITNAITNGRGGLGCVILFASGNDNTSSLPYPHNSNTNLINVGAMSPCAERKNPGSCDGENWWGSNYGTGLDVMAPGVLISTTDRQGSNGYNNNAGTAGNYTTGFNGTSSACPSAAGVAALVLSVNPCLTQAQVQQILKRSSQKVGAYSYSTILTDGSWNNQMGHGLLHAGDAVRMAGTNYLQNLTESTTQTHKGWFVRAGFNINPFIPTGNYVTTASANITIHALNTIEFEAGTDLQGAVDAQILDPGSCNTW